MGNPVIKADFNEVDAGSTRILQTARSINAELDDFNKYVNSFVEQKWEGETNASFAQSQAQWHVRSKAMNDALESAAAVVNAGNSNLQATDTNLAGLF